MQEVKTQREVWLASRRKGIGGSDASSVLGVNPWKSNVALWEEKTGRREPANLDDNPAVKYGKEAEECLRNLFCLDFPGYLVHYDEFKMLSNLPGCPWLFATLDGELTEFGTGRKGVLEIKTTAIRNAQSWEQWKDQIPQYYYIQILHQLLATGYDFAVLKAQLKDERGARPDDVRSYIRHYTIERQDVEEDLQNLLSKEKEFWRYVEADKRPPQILPEI